MRGAPSHTDLLGSVLTAPHTSITTRRAACRGPSPALEGVEIVVADPLNTCGTLTNAADLSGKVALMQR